MLRDLAIACSLANLCLFSVWGQLLPGSPLHYFLEQPPPRAALLIAMAWVAILALAFWAGATLARHSDSAGWKQVARLIFVVLVLAALNGIRRQTPQLALRSLGEAIGKPGLVVLAAALGVGGALVFAKWWPRAVRALAMIVLLFFPFALLTLSRATWAILSHDTAYADFANGPYAPRLPSVGERPGRVVWLVFDELDYRIAFEQRPAGLQLPELDRFAAQSVHATQAYPPAGETLLSIPALLTGKQVSRAEPTGPRRLWVAFADATQTTVLNEAPNIFSAWRQAGRNAAAVGVGLPYCRLFNESLIDCAWVSDYGGQTRKHVPGLSVAETAIIQAADVLDSFPLATRLGVRRTLISRLGGARAKRRLLGVQRYERTLEDAKRFLAGDAADLVYLHFPVPHSPYIYDREKGALVDGEPRSYADNLDLTDRTLGELRRTMEAAGRWDSATVLITSDHWYRINLWKPWKSHGEDAALGRETDFRVPMMLKLPGQQEARAYDQPFTTTLVPPLLLAVGEEVRTAEDAIRWLEQHHKYSPPVCGRNSGCGGKRPIVPEAG